MMYVERNNLETYIAQGAPWVSWHPQTLADQIIPGGADYAHHITTGTPGFSDLPMALVHLIPPILLFDQPLVALLVSLLLSRDTTLSIGGIGLTKVSIPLS